MKTNRRAFGAAAGLALLGMAAGDGSRRPARRTRTEPRLLCEIPDLDYLHGNPPREGRAFSSPGILVRAVGPPGMVVPTGAVAYGYFQLARGRIAVDHCSISAVVLTIGDNGGWALGFRANQNPEGGAVEPRILPGATGSTRYTAHIRRNLFAIRVRGLGASRAEVDPEDRVGRPVLFTLSPAPFWVQRGVELSPTLRDVDAGVAASFRYVDRIEVVLSYQ